MAWRKGDLVNVLVLCHPYPNYVPDLLLHGLRKLLGDHAVDYPRKDVLYQGICGQPNLDKVPGLMADDSQVDRSDIDSAVRAGFFDFVIADVRALNDHVALLQDSSCPLAIVDGEDSPFPIKPGPYAILRRETDGSDFSIPLQMAIPQEVLDWIDRHADEPKRHSIGFLGSRSPHTPDRNSMLDEIGRSFPDSLVSSWSVGADSGAKGRDTYYQALQSCKLLLSLPGAGYDTFRYWENAACVALHVAKAMPLLIPDDFREGREIMRFSTPQELAAIVEQALAGRIDWRGIAERSRAWLRAHHTTERRATQVLDRLKRAFCL
jgi:hypothetical protein